MYTPGWVKSENGSFSRATKVAQANTRNKFLIEALPRCIRPGGGMVYTKDLKSFARKGLWVRVPPRAHSKRLMPFLLFDIS